MAPWLKRNFKLLVLGFRKKVIAFAQLPRTNARKIAYKKIPRIHGTVDAINAFKSRHLSSENHPVQLEVCYWTHPWNLLRTSSISSFCDNAASVIVWIFLCSEGTNCRGFRGFLLSLASY